MTPEAKEIIKRIEEYLVANDDVGFYESLELLGIVNVPRRTYYEHGKLMLDRLYKTDKEILERMK